ncbi:MAG: hypothetical protein II239_07395 [Peptococcaceae bacterium]|nr:hypothetical protein [Peptococcaceae bacterium]
MKKKLTALILLTALAVVLLTGCGASSTIEGRVFDAEGAGHYRNLIDADLHSFAFDYRDDIQGTVKTLEVWQNGICTETHVLGQGRYAQNKIDEYYFVMDRVRDEENNCIGMELRSLSYSSDGQMAAHSMLVPVKLHFASSFDSYAFGFVDGKLKVEPGNMYILGFWDMDMADDGHTDISIDSLNSTNYQEVMQKSEYIIILKEQLFNTVEEAEALAKCYHDK